MESFYRFDTNKYNSYTNCTVRAQMLCSAYTTNYKRYNYYTTPDNSNLQGKSLKVRVIGSSNFRELEAIAGSKGKTSFYCTVNIFIIFNCTSVKRKMKDTSRL